MLIKLVLLALLLAAALSDFWAFRIPNGISLSILALFLLNALPQVGEIDWPSHAAAGGLVFAGGLVLYALGGIGAGDVKLLAATATWLGMALLMPHLLLTSVAGLVLMLLLVAMRRWLPSTAPERLPAALRPGRRIPYGVAIAASAAFLVHALPPQHWLA